MPIVPMKVDPRTVPSVPAPAWKPSRRLPRIPANDVKKLGKLGKLPMYLRPIGKFVPTVVVGIGIVNLLDDYFNALPFLHPKGWTLQFSCGGSPTRQRLALRTSCNIASTTNPFAGDPIGTMVPAISRNLEYVDTNYINTVGNTDLYKLNNTHQWRRNQDPPYNTAIPAPGYVPITLPAINIAPNPNALRWEETGFAPYQFPQEVPLTRPKPEPEVIERQRQRKRKWKRGRIGRFVPWPDDGTITSPDRDLDNDEPTEQDLEVDPKTGLHPGWRFWHDLQTGSSRRPQAQRDRATARTPKTDPYEMTKPHNRGRTRTRVKERKVKSQLAGLGIALFKILDNVSEKAELVDALFDALPDDVTRRWRHCKKKRGPVDTFGQYGIDQADCKAQALWHNWHRLDTGLAVKNIAKNVLEDQIIGAYQRRMPKQAGNAFTRPLDGNKEISPEMIVSQYLDDLFGN